MRQRIGQLGRGPVLFCALVLLYAANAAAAALPVTFEENRGQVAREVAFRSRTAGYDLFLIRQGAVIALQDGDVVRIRLADSRNSRPVGTHRVAAKTNYLVGPDPARWKSGIANYEGVTYPQVYPGIDLAWHTRGDQVEHDFLVAASANPNRIRLIFSNAALRLTPKGDLMAGTLRFDKPRAYQGNREVACRYVLHGRSLRFALGPYDHSRSLTIDPVLSFSTFLGGTPDTNTNNAAGTVGSAVALDPAGNVFVAGSTSSLDFPVTDGAFQRTSPGGVCFTEYVGVPVGVPITSPCSQMFVAKFSRDGATLLYATYLGGPGNNTATAIAAGSTGNLYLLGKSSSPPGSNTPVQFPRLMPLPGQTIGTGTSLIAELSADGASLLYATALPVDPRAVAVDAAGAVYLTGTATSGLPAVQAFQPALAQASIFKASSANSWQPLTNGLPGGTVVAADLANAQVLYLGTLDRLYKTSDGGMTWSPIFNSQANVNSVVMDPHSPQTLYLGSLADQDMVYKSTDGGATWSVSGSFSANSPPCLALDPSTPSTIYAGTTFGIYKSTDAGSTWNPILLAAPNQNAYSVSRIVIDPTQTATIYAGTALGVMKSVDGGVSWKAMTNGITTDQASLSSTIKALALDPGSPQTLYAATAGQSGVYKTTDGGNQWTLTTWPFPHSRANGLLVDPQIHSRIWAAATDGALVSLDSGASWTRTLLPHLYTQSIAADAAGAIYVTGSGSPSDAFAMKLDATGSTILYSTYLGGTGSEVAGGIAVDAAGRAYIAGETDSPDFPLAAPLQPSFGGNSDIFVAVLDPVGSHLVWSTFVGGSAAEGASSIALDAAGNVHLAGIISPADPFLATNPDASGPYPSDTTADALAGKIKAGGSGLVFSTHIGGSNFDTAGSVAADAAGNTYIVGSTRSKDLPAVNAVQSALAGTSNVLVAEFDGQSGAVQYATYLGGSQYDFGHGIAVDGGGNAYITGLTLSSDFPVKDAWQGSPHGSQAFVAKLAPLTPTLGLIGLTNAASYTAPVAPGELVSIFGTVLASSSAPATQLPLPAQLGGAQVTVNGISAPLVYASPQQINAQIPFETQPGTAQVQVSTSAGVTTMSVQVAATVPAIFTINQQGTGAGAILHGTTYQVVSDNNPAAAGEIISIYCTGLGAVNPPAQTGAPPDPSSQTVIPVQVSIGGMTAQVLYAGVAPGFPGLYQVNAQIPPGMPSGAQPLQIIQNNVSSNTATVVVQ